MTVLIVLGLVLLLWIGLQLREATGHLLAHTALLAEHSRKLDAIASKIEDVGDRADETRSDLSSIERSVAALEDHFTGGPDDLA